ncbi:MAG TPA: hypothetical protein P5550_11730, partial [Bacteroidales bacterium]|nr:hypothetical protein [Bacteroidales bacterium]
YIQVQDTAYWKNRSINHSLRYDNSLQHILRSDRNVSGLVPRLESFALASSGELTKGVMVIGIDPGPEDLLTQLAARVNQGNYLTPTDEGVLLGEKLAAYLQLSVNDTLVLIGQGYHGVSAAGKFPVRGLVHYPNPDMSGQMVVMSLSQAQYFLAIEGRVTSIVLDVRDRAMAGETAASLDSGLPPGLTAMDWKTMLPELVQAIESDNASGKIMLGILYMVIGFGILGTVIMMTAERRREMGVMVAVGLQRWKLALITALETLTLALIGVAAGVVTAIPLLEYLHRHPVPATGEMKEMIEEYGMEAVLVFSRDPALYRDQALIVALIALTTLAYPVVSILLLKPIRALRH